MDTPTIHAAYAAAFAQIEGATKSANNPHFKSKYADLTSVIEAIKPALAAHGLFFTQCPQTCDGGVTIETTLHHESGQSIALGSLFMPANRNDAQAYGSALTYARRYALVTAFGVPTEDDDGNAASKEPPAKREAPVKLAGPFTSHTALQGAIRNIIHEMNGCGDASELSGLLHSSDAQALFEQVKRDKPEWWHGGPDMPGDFVPLSRQIEMKEYEMAQQVADIARA